MKNPPLILVPDNDYLDEYDDYINHEKTYEIVASKLFIEGKVMIPWTDQRSTHYDILFVYKTDILMSHNVQGGIRKTDLFVCIMRKGAFGFEINENPLSSEYVGEKLLHGESGITSEKLAELLTGVKLYLNKLETAK